MQAMIATSTVPYVAIGGIDLTNLRDVLAAGARNFCMVRQIMQAEEPEMLVKEIQRIWREYR
jgi:thiamine-phosphate pyrophosphorylase